MTPTRPAPIQAQLTDAAHEARCFAARLGQSFYARTDEIRGLLLAAIAGHNVLLLGPPGTAKSDLTNEFAAGLGWTSFVRLVGKTTVPEELFGPFSLLGLEQDRFERQVARYLPTAEVAFLDEIFKGSSAILNSLLTALNEHAFDNGTQRIAIPLRICVGASNELPEPGLEALFDRFLVRYWVDYLASDDDFAALLTATRGPTPMLDPAVIETLSAAARSVDLSRVVPAVVAIRNRLREERLQISDRRWKQSMSIVAASAVLDGRTAALPRDLAVLRDTLWDRPEHRDLIGAVVAELSNPELRQVTGLLEELRKLISEAPKAPTLGELAGVKAALARIEAIAVEAKPIGEASTDPEVRETWTAIAREGAKFRAFALKATASTKL